MRGRLKRGCATGWLKPLIIREIGAQCAAFAAMRLWQGLAGDQPLTGALHGRITVKRVPAPSRDSTPMRPPSKVVTSR
jgi:hypothetical protein